MSRTDRHRPYWVQLQDGSEQDWRWHWSGWTLGWVRLPLYRTCGCSNWGCSMSKTRTTQNRFRRHRDQRLQRDAVKGNLEAWDHRIQVARHYW